MLFVTTLFLLLTATTAATNNVTTTIELSPAVFKVIVIDNNVALDDLLYQAVVQHLQQQLEELTIRPGSPLEAAGATVTKWEYFRATATQLHVLSDDNDDDDVYLLELRLGIVVHLDYANGNGGGDPLIVEARPDETKRDLRDAWQKGLVDSFNVFLLRLTVTPILDQVVKIQVVQKGQEVIQATVADVLPSPPQQSANPLFVLALVSLLCMTLVLFVLCCVIRRQVHHRPKSSWNCTPPVRRQQSSSVVIVSKLSCILEDDDEDDDEDDKSTVEFRNERRRRDEECPRGDGYFL